MHGFYVALVFVIIVGVYFCFAVKDFAAFCAHILSRSGFRSAVAFDNLT
jgi:hypothetical protein